MAVKKNELNGLLNKLVAARDKTNNKLAVLAVEGGIGASSYSDSFELTLDEFAENYNAKLNEWIGRLTAPEEGSFRAKKNIRCSAFEIAKTVKYNAERGYFQFGDPTFKIHWMRRGNPKLKGIALEFKDKIISYGSGDDEILSSIILIIHATIHALYNLATTDEKNIILNKFSAELVQYPLDATKANIIEIQSGKSYSERSERFQFEDAFFDVKVTSIAEDVSPYIYMTVAKAAEFEELLSRENVRQFAAQILLKDTTRHCAKLSN